MARKRASLKGKGPEIIKRGQGVDALFGGGTTDETADDVEMTPAAEPVELEEEPAPEAVVEDEALASLAAESDVAGPGPAAEASTAEAGAVAQPVTTAESVTTVGDGIVVQPEPAPFVEDLPSDEADFDFDELLGAEADKAGPGLAEEGVPPGGVAAVSPADLPPALESVPPDELPPALEFLPPEELPPATEGQPAVEDLPAFELDEEAALPAFERDEGLEALATEAGAAEPVDTTFSSQPPSRPMPAPPPAATTDGSGIPAAAYTVPPPASTQSSPPSTVTGAPSLSRKTPLVFDAAEDADLFDFTSSRREAEPVIFDSPAEELTAEQRAAKLKDQRILEQFNQVYEAIDEQYQRILDLNISVSKEITDWSQNLLAESRYITLEYQVEHLARAEWNIEQVRARLDRAEESQAKRVYAWIISIWGLGWFILFVTAIFRVRLLTQFLGTDLIASDLLVPEIFLTTLFFGGIGGVTAVFYHLHYYVSKRTYDISFNLSYAAKPFMGMILGTLVYMIVFGIMRYFGLVPGIMEGLPVEDSGGVIFWIGLVWFLALAAGFKENLAFELLERVMKVIFRRQAGDEDAHQAEPPPKPIFESKG